MRDSDTYWAIIEEGEVIQANRDILRIGVRRFGAPNAGIAAQLEGIPDLARFDRITERLLEATSWQDLLATP